MSDLGPLGHQDSQPFPQLGSAMVDPATGVLDPSWYRLLISFWQKLGGRFSIAASAVFVQRAGGGVGFFDSNTGIQIGGLALTSPRPISFFQAGKPGSGAPLLDYPRAGVDFLLPQNLPGSVGGVDLAGAAPTLDAVFPILLNSFQLGTMTIPAGATPGANSAFFIFSRPVNFAEGQHLRILAPSPQDATLDSPFCSLLADIGGP